MRGGDQRTLAREARVAPSVVSRLERGLQDDLNASVLVSLAHSLGTSVEALLTNGAQIGPPGLVTELTVMLDGLSRLPPMYQRQVAAMLQGYMSSIPRDR